MIELQYKKEYVDEKKSIPEIAEKYNTYPNKVRRALLKLGVTIRSKSEAQKLALESGNAVHPTEGKKRPESTKVKISNKIAKSWESMTTRELTARKKKMKKLWDKKSDKDKENMQKLAAKAVAQAGREGSKIEKYLKIGLEKTGLNVIFHKEGLIQNTELQLDLFIPDYKIVIEIDGPSHFFPIWGQEKLDKKIASDKEKNGLLLAAGYSVIRVKYLVKTLTEKKKRDTLTQILEIIKLNKNRKSFYIEVEL